VRLSRRIRAEPSGVGADRVLGKMVTGAASIAAAVAARSRSGDVGSCPEHPPMPRSARTVVASARIRCGMIRLRAASILGRSTEQGHPPCAQGENDVFPIALPIQFVTRFLCRYAPVAARNRLDERMSAIDRQPRAQALSSCGPHTRVCGRSSAHRAKNDVDMHRFVARITIAL